MGKWAARLTEESAAPLRRDTDKTDERGLVSVLAVTEKGNAAEFDAATNAANDASRGQEESDLAGLAWTDGDIGRFLHRRTGLVRRGWAIVDAERLAERLVQRDREGDTRVSCTECTHYLPGRCWNPAQARLSSSVIGLDLAALLQMCPGFRTAA